MGDSPNPYDPVATPRAYDLYDGRIENVNYAEQADPNKGERWCGTHRAVEVGPCPDYQLPTLDADDIRTIKGALEYVSVVLAGTEMSAANLPRLTAIVRAQAKLDLIGDGGTFVATPF